MRTAARKDDNHDLIKKTAKSIGASWKDVHQLKGFCDGVCGFRGVNYLIEIKDPSQPKSKRKLTPDEQSFVDGWNGQYKIIETPKQLIEMLTEG